MTVRRPFDRHGRTRRWSSEDVIGLLSLVTGVALMVWLIASAVAELGDHGRVWWHARVAQDLIAVNGRVDAMVLMSARYPLGSEVSMLKVPGRDGGLLFSGSVDWGMLVRVVTELALLVPSASVWLPCVAVEIGDTPE
ncbi:MAG: hypothetical protein IPO43_04925 [Rhodoferax sp.]|nr:hypothetical protein [Rhodoferax sp.]